MIRAGTIGRVPTWTPDPDRFPRFALLDGPSPLAPLPRLSVRSAIAPNCGSSARTCCRWRSAATSCGTSSSSSGRRWPTAPTPGHVGTALVEPRPPDRRRRGARRAGRPSRPVRTADRPAEPEPASSTSCSARPSTRPRPTTAPNARPWSPGSSRTCARRVVGPAVIEVGGTGAVGAVGQVAGRPRARRPARAAGISEPTASSCRRRPVAPRPVSSSGCARPGPRPRSRGSRSRPRTSSDRRSSRSSRRSAPLTGSRRRPADEIVLDGSQLGDGLRPADGGRRRGDPPARPDRGDPRRPDLHRQGAGRALARAGGARPAALDGRRRPSSGTPTPAGLPSRAWPATPRGRRGSADRRRYSPGRPPGVAAT